MRYHVIAPEIEEDMNEPNLNTSSNNDEDVREVSEAVLLAEAAARTAEAEAEKARAEADKVRADSTNKWEGLGCIVLIAAIALVMVIGALAKAGVFS